MIAILDVKDWTTCSCQLYIRDDDNGGDDVPDKPIDPEVIELEKMVKL